MTVRLGVAYWLTRACVFRDREARSTAVELPLFLAVALANMAVVEAALAIAQVWAGGKLGAHEATFVKFGAIALTFFGPYAVSRRWVFRGE